LYRFAQTISGGTQSFLTSTYRSPENSPDADRPHIEPHKLQWQLNTELIQGIRFAEARLSDLIQQNEVRVLEFNVY